MEAKSMAKTDTPVDVDSLLAGGNAMKEMLADVELAPQISALKKELQTTRSVSKKDAIVKKIKYLSGLEKLNMTADQAYVLNHVPLPPPQMRPVIPMGNNKIEYADVNYLYKDHMYVNNVMKDMLPLYSHDQMVDQRKALNDGVKAVFGLGDAITGASRGKDKKGYIRQISGDTGPKTGLFQSKLLSKKQDFSGRATIYAEPNLGFNEMAVPKDMLWDMYKLHIIRDLVRNGMNLISARQAWDDRTSAAMGSFNKLIKEIPIIANRAPTLMRTNITAHFPVPVDGKTLGVNPLHLPMYAGDYDGDALSIYTPKTPEAIQEAKEKLLPQHHIHDYRRGLNSSMVAPGHEAILGSMHMTEPDMSQKPVHFKSEQEALQALKEGKIKENTPLTIG